MCPTILALAAGLVISLPQQNQLTEAQAVAYLQQLPVQQLEKALPPVTFGNWIRQVAGPETGLTWMMTECGTQGRPEVPACVEVNGVLPNLRKFAVVIRVGTVRAGFDGRPAVQFAMIENKGKLFNVPGLTDLPEMLRMRVIKPRRRPVVLPVIPEKRVPLWFAAIRLAPDLDRPAAESSGFLPPHLRSPAPVPSRVSEGALIGSALTRIVPDYPLLARQNRITGQVVVQVTIAEDGRVIDAVAVSGPPVLRTVSEEAARKWIFRPTVLNGVPVRLQGNLTFVFSQP